MNRCARTMLAVVVLCTSALAGARVLSAQQPPPAADPAKALKGLQDQLELARKERIALEAKLEKQQADEIAARAKTLAMGGEAGALQRLELLLDSAQARLLVQRDRIRQLKDATELNQQALLVVLVRADSLAAGDVAAVLLVDGTEVKSATYKPEQAKALTAGAPDELYRAGITAAEHKVFVRFAGKGFSVGESVTIPAAPKLVTYVEFVLKGGRLVSSTWTNKGATF